MTKSNFKRKKNAEFLPRAQLNASQRPTEDASNSVVQFNRMHWHKVRILYRIFFLTLRLCVCVCVKCSSWPVVIGEKTSFQCVFIWCSDHHRGTHTRNKCNRNRNILSMKRERKEMGNQRTHKFTTPIPDMCFVQFLQPFAALTFCLALVNAKGQIKHMFYASVNVCDASNKHCINRIVSIHSVAVCF